MIARAKVVMVRRFSGRHEVAVCDLLGPKASPPTRGHDDHAEQKHSGEQSDEVEHRQDAVQADRAEHEQCARDVELRQEAEAGRDDSKNDIERDADETGVAAGLIHDAVAAASAAAWSTGTWQEGQLL
jgi:hypothetical protein